MSSSPALEVQRLRYVVGGATIIDDVSFAVAHGEMLGVIGPNGAGKTTLFNLVSGIAPLTSGRVLMDGRDVTRSSVHHRARVGLGRTFQTSSLFPALSVRENVRLAAQARLGGALSVLAVPRDRDEADAVATERLRDVGLDHHAATTAGVLSHGDKRKLEVAMLLAADPAVILLDEPMAGVASGDVGSLTQLIRSVHRGGRTVLMVEHHLDVLLDLVDRVAVMHHGKLLAIGTPDEVVADPAVQAAYLGEAV
ncbi:MAG: ABC transporter ATP-binding protein [Micrococcales bacterium 72-143]|nr:MAG: ABC transporter ATP-binding protein [Micrococcales bacterium 72-143]